MGIFALLTCVPTWARSTNAVKTGSEATPEMEPYHVIHVHMEEGSGDPVEARRRWEEGKAEKKRAAELAEGEARALSKIDAALASQKALSAKISDIRTKDDACFRNAIILRALSDCLRGCVAFQAQLRSSR